MGRKRSIEVLAGLKRCWRCREYVKRIERIGRRGHTLTEPVMTTDDGSRLMVFNDGSIGVRGPNGGHKGYALHACRRSDARKYYLSVFTPANWCKLLETDAALYGVHEFYANLFARVRPGDFLICYLSGASRFVGALRITSLPFSDTARVWKDDLYPLRVRTAPVLLLPPEHGIPAVELRDRLKLLAGVNTPKGFGNIFHAGFREWNERDAGVVLARLRSRRQRPQPRAIKNTKISATMVGILAREHARLVSRMGVSEGQVARL